MQPLQSTKIFGYFRAAPRVRGRCWSSSKAASQRAFATSATLNVQFTFVCGWGRGLTPLAFVCLFLINFVVSSTQSNQRWQFETAGEQRYSPTRTGNRGTIFIPWARFANSLPQMRAPLCTGWDKNHRKGEMTGERVEESLNKQLVLH